MVYGLPTDKNKVFCSDTCRDKYFGGYKFSEASFKLPKNAVN